MWFMDLRIHPVVLSNLGVSTEERRFHTGTYARRKGPFTRSIRTWSGTCRRGVWDYMLGGYPVIKKWISYREERVLGRHLRPEEARAVTDIVRRITAIVMMGPALDEVYAAVKRAGFDRPPRIG